MATDDVQARRVRVELLVLTGAQSDRHESRGDRESVAHNFAFVHRQLQPGSEGVATCRHTTR